MVQQGHKAPDFHLPTTKGVVSLEELLQEGKLVLSFYREDNTPG